MDGTGSDLYSSSENSPESHHRLLHHHQHVHQQQMLASRLSPVSPANDEHHYQMLQHQHAGVISQPGHHALVHPAPPDDESASNG